jgi:hypothetical protein
MDLHHRIHSNITQGLGRNAQSQEKLSVLVTLPGNITDKSQLIIEFDEASNGGILVIYAPRGIMSTNMDKVQLVMASMPGCDKQDALLLVQPLEAKLMMQRKNRNIEITDKFIVVLDKACDPHKTPIATVCRSKDDGDTVCLIIMDVPSNNDYECNLGGSNSVFEV